MGRCGWGGVGWVVCVGWVGHVGWLGGGLVVLKTNPLPLIFGGVYKIFLDPQP